MKYQKNLRRAFDEIYDHNPLFSSFVMRWNVIPTDDVPYAATNGPDLFLNPDFMDSLNIAETLKVVKHEAGHVFLGHMYRVPLNSIESDIELHEWNIAMDEALNDLIATQDRSFDTPPGQQPDKIAEILIFPGRMHKEAGDRFYSHPRGKDAEFYHSLIKKSRPESPTDPQPSTSKSPGNKSEVRSGSGNKPEVGSEKSDGNGSGNGKIPTIPPSVRGPGRSDLPRSFGDVLPHPALESEDEEKIEESIQEWKQEAARAINNARQQGTLPGWVEEIASKLYGQQSKQNWRAILRRWMTRVVSFGGQTYDKPNRRHSWRRDIIIPANRSRQASKGGVVHDTSGSMDEARINIGLSEMEAILKTFTRCEVDLFMADTRLITYKKTFHRSDFPLRVLVNWKGRGGTNLSPAINEVASDRSYKWLVVISDMEWRVDRCVNPKIPVIWIWTPRPGVTKLETHQKPAFGLLIGPVEVNNH